MAARKLLVAVTWLFSGLSLLLCLLVLGFWLAGLRATRPDPLWLRFNGSQHPVQYAIGSLNGQMELRRLRQDQHPLTGPHCGARAACAAFERQFPPAVRYEYLGCSIGWEPVIDVVGREETLVKTGTAWFVIVPQGVAAIVLGAFPAILILQFVTRRWSGAEAGCEK